MYVCICQAVSDHTVRELLETMTLEEVKDETGACRTCCKCCDDLNKIEQEVRNERQI